MELLTYSVEEVVEMLGTARSATYQAVREGRIPAIRMGRRWLIPRDRFHAWLNGKIERTEAA